MTGDRFTWNPDDVIVWNPDVLERIEGVEDDRKVERRLEDDHYDPGEESYGSWFSEPDR